MSRSTRLTTVDAGITSGDDEWITAERDPEILADLLWPLLPLIQRRLECCPDQSGPAYGPPTLSQVRAMIFLADHDAVPVGHLAAALHLSRPAATELIDRLAERKLVTRAANPVDRRQVLIALTPKARMISKDLRDYRLERLTRVIAALPPGQRQGFVRGMMLLAQELDSEDASPTAKSRIVGDIPVHLAASEDSTHD